MGSADGITIELIDIWMAWLVIQYAYLLKTDQVKPIRGIGAFCLPIAVLLLADILSFRQSADAALSLYGLLADLRATVLFILVAVTLVQGADEVRGALTGMLWAVLMIGALCVFETAVGVNFREDPFVADQEAEWAGPFRARGFNSATNTAAYLAVLMPIVVVEVSRASSLSRIWLARAALVAGLTGLACTLTRSAIGFLAVGSLPLIVFLFRQRILRFKHAFIALAAGVVLLVALGDLIRSRMNEESENMTARFGLIGTALNMAADSPLTGQGTNNYMLKMQEFSPKRQIHHFEFIVHNKFLLTLAETGTLGLVAFVWFIVVTLTRAVSLARRQSLLGVGLLCSLIVVVLNMNMEIYAGGFTLFTFWVIAAFVAALSQGRAGDSTLAHEAAR
jgi:O-antigen ligase